MEIYHPRDEELLREMRRVRRSNRRRRLMWGLIISLLLCAAAGFVLLHWVYAVHWVSGPSMGDVLPSGSLALVRRSPADGYQRGDLVLYYKEDIPSVKRVIATGGENVVINPYSENEFRVDGQELEEPYTIGRSLDAGVTTRRQSVAENELFVAGDNRVLSMDSRFRDYGTIPEEDTVGRVEVILWPLYRLGTVTSEGMEPLLQPILNLFHGSASTAVPEIDKEADTEAEPVEPEAPAEAPSGTEIAAPESTATPSPTETPESTESPTATDAPEETAATATTETPENTAAPTVTGTPEITSTPVPTEAPTPEETEAPAATESTTPENTPSSAVILTTKQEGSK